MRMQAEYALLPPTYSEYERMREEVDIPHVPTSIPQKTSAAQPGSNAKSLRWDRDMRSAAGRATSSPNREESASDNGAA